VQGCIFAGEIIPKRKKFFAGMLFQWRNHPWTEEILCRDAFPVEKSSLNGRNALQGLFSNGGIIPERKKFCPRMHMRWETASQKHKTQIKDTSLPETASSKA